MNKFIRNFHGCYLLPFHRVVDPLQAFGHSWPMQILCFIFLIWVGIANIFFIVVHNDSIHAQIASFMCIIFIFIVSYSQLLIMIFKGTFSRLAIPYDLFIYEYKQK